jgi:hypothetical protein
LLYSALGDHAKASKSAGFASSTLDSFNAVRALNIAAVQRGEQGVTVPPPLCDAVKYAFQVSNNDTVCALSTDHTADVRRISVVTAS